MIYFPTALLRHARDNGCPMGWMFFKKLTAPTVPFTEDGNIVLNQLDANRVSDSPAKENYTLGVVIRHPVYNEDDSTVGISAIQTLFYDYLKSIRGADIDDNWTIEELEEEITPDHGMIYSDGFYQFITQVRFTVEDHYRS